MSFFGLRAQALDFAGKCLYAGALDIRAAADTAVGQLVLVKADIRSDAEQHVAPESGRHWLCQQAAAPGLQK